MKAFFFVALLSATAFCRHRPDIFKDNITMGEAFKNAEKAYTKFKSDDPNAPPINFDGVKDVFKSVLNSGMLILSKPQCGSLFYNYGKQVKVVREGCGEKVFEEFAINFTDSVKNALTSGMTAKDKEAYLKWAKLADDVAERMPELPGDQPLDLGSVILAVLIILVFILALLVSCMCSCFCGNSSSD